MSFFPQISFRQITRGVRVLGNRKAADQEIADEVSHYLAETEAALRARGLSADEARRAARIEAGHALAVQEQVRDYGWENSIETLFADLRYAARRLRGSPGFAAVSILTLALGVGASTAIFSVIDGVLLKPLPYPHSEQLVALLHTAPGINIPELNLAASLYFTYSEHNHVFQDVGMWAKDSWSITGVGEPEKVAGLLVTHRFLSTLGVEPVYGRGFSARDENPDSPRVVMLSDGYWRSRFGGDRTVIGKHLVVDGDPYVVIGVLPASFEFMDRPISLMMPLRF